MNQFWWGVVASPFILLAAFWLLWMIGKGIKGWRLWFLGLPIFQYPAMWAVMIGCHVLNKNYCYMRKYDSRLWMSPKVARFEVKADNEE